jgi:hypothetical protein
MNPKATHIFWSLHLPPIYQAVASMRIFTSLPQKAPPNFVNPFEQPLLWREDSKEIGRYGGQGCVDPL